jgi:hypothetical protein
MWPKSLNFFCNFQKRAELTNRSKFAQSGHPDPCRRGREVPSWKSGCSFECTLTYAASHQKNASEMLEKFQPKKRSFWSEKVDIVDHQFHSWKWQWLQSSPDNFWQAETSFKKSGIYLSQMNTITIKLKKQRCNVQSPENLTPWRDSNPRSSDSIAETMTMPPRATAETSASVSEWWPLN